ncbi:MAG: hypothetical protein AAFN74_28055, partial [Myxococcota bacterium]
LLLGDILRHGLEFFFPFELLGFDLNGAGRRLRDGRRIGRHKRTRSKLGRAAHIEGAFEVELVARRVAEGPAFNPPPAASTDPSFAFGGTPGERLTFGEPAAAAEADNLANNGGLAFSDAPRNEFNFEGTFDVGGPPKLRSGSFVAPDPSTISQAPSGPVQVKPQKLEGEEELEAMAQNVAQQK